MQNKLNLAPNLAATSFTMVLVPLSDASPSVKNITTVSIDVSSPNSDRTASNAILNEVQPLGLYFNKYSDTKPSSAVTCCTAVSTQSSNMMADTQSTHPFCSRTVRKVWIALYSAPNRFSKPP
eukprot:UN06513